VAIAVSCARRSLLNSGDSRLEEADRVVSQDRGLAVLLLTPASPEAWLLVDVNQGGRRTRVENASNLCPSVSQLKGFCKNPVADHRRLGRTKSFV